MTEFEKQQKIITDMYKRIGSERDGDFVTVGFVGSGKTYSSTKRIVDNIKKVDSEFFNFNNVLSEFL